LLALALGLLLAMVWYLRPVATDADAAVSEAQISEIINNRCIACHSSKPTQPGFVEAPLGIVLETPQQVEARADRIAATVQTRYMPLGNLTGMTDAERAAVAGWYAQQRQ
jgi:uncharacterized membrane protein